jgi:hypothetical protein
MSASLTATVTVPGAVGPTGVSGAAPGPLIGSMTFSGTAAGSETISQWLTRLEQVEGWVNPWVSSATENGERSRIYQFTSGVDLTIDAATERGRGGTTTP